MLGNIEQEPTRMCSLNIEQEVINYLDKWHKDLNYISCLCRKHHIYKTDILNVINGYDWEKEEVFDLAEILIIIATKKILYEKVINKKDKKNEMSNL